MVPCKHATRVRLRAPCTSHVLIVPPPPLRMHVCKCSRLCQACRAYASRLVKAYFVHAGAHSCAAYAARARNASAVCLDAETVMPAARPKLYLVRDSTLGISCMYVVRWKYSCRMCCRPR
eukprot:6201429-Pleurochrysis_carterae.AAC.2